MGRGGAGGSKKCKPIPAPPRDAGLKSHPIPAPPPLRGGENPHGAKRGGAGQNCHPYQAVPKYTMSCFKLPDSICKELTSMVRNFWWGQKVDERKMS